VGGLLLGGLITATLGWRWIFFVNLPIGAFGAIWTFTSLHEIASIDQGEPFDTYGMVLFVGGILLALLGLTVVIGGGGPAVPWLLTTGMLALMAFVIYERRARSPLIDLRLFSIRIFTFGNASLFLNALARGALMFLMTFSFQGLLGVSPLTAGLMMLPLTIAIMVIGPISGRLSDRFGSRELSSGGLLITAVSLAMLSHASLTGPYTPIAFALLLAGIGNGLFNSPNTSAVMGAVPPDRRGVAASTRTLLFNAGQLFSLALSFTILSTTMGGGQLSGFLAGMSTQAASIGHAAFARGLGEAFAISTVLSLIAAVLSALRGKVAPSATA
jgi:MFS family permease